MTSVAGVVPILLTPVGENGVLAEDDLCNEVDHVLAAGVTTLGFGYASEPYRLSQAERERALQVVVEHTARRAGVVAHLQAGSTAAGKADAERLASLGADALMVPAPYAGDESQYLDHYGAIAEAAGVPIVVQDAASFGVAEMSVACLTRLAKELPQVVAIKVETPPTPPKVAALVDAVGGHASVLGGGGGIEFFNELERGVDGTMPGASLADYFARVWNLHRAGESDEAQELFIRLLPILTLALRSAEAFMQVEKELLRRRGVISFAGLRAPAFPPDSGLSHELDLHCRVLEVPEQSASRQ
jgi:4-hydroxy-tetrahydrodipicolinate synthase